MGMALPRAAHSGGAESGAGGVGGAVQSPVAASAAGLGRPGGVGVPRCVVLGPSGPGVRGWCLLEHPGVAVALPSPLSPPSCCHHCPCHPSCPCCPHHPATLQDSQHLPFRHKNQLVLIGTGPCLPSSPQPAPVPTPCPRSLWDSSTKVPRQPGPVPSPAPSAPSGAAQGSQCRLGSGSGPSARSPRLIVLPPRCPHTATCASAPFWVTPAAHPPAPGLLMN